MRLRDKAKTTCARRNSPTSVRGDRFSVHASVRGLFLRARGHWWTVPAFHDTCTSETKQRSHVHAGTVHRRSRAQKICPLRIMCTQDQFTNSPQWVGSPRGGAAFTGSECLLNVLPECLPQNSPPSHNMRTQDQLQWMLLYGCRISSPSHHTYTQVQFTS